MLTFNQNAFMINSIQLETVKLYFAHLQKIKMDNLYLTLKNQANLEDRTVKHQTRAFSSIKNKNHKFTSYFKNYMWKAEHISTVSNKITVWERAHIHAHKRILFSFLGDQTHSYRFCFFILDSLSAYTIGGGELIKGQIRQEQRPRQEVKSLKILKCSYS